MKRMLYNLTERINGSSLLSFIVNAINPTSGVLLVYINNIIYSYICMCVIILTGILIVARAYYHENNMKNKVLIALTEGMLIGADIIVLVGKIN